jgi:hypothetical protein
VDKSINTFNEGMNLNLADLVMKQTMSRLCMGMRIIDLDSSTYALTNIRGTEETFQLTSGYIPLASEQYKNVLYILSINPTTNISEIGTYPSPAYGGGTSYNVYRPLNNLNAGPFRTSAFGYSVDDNLKLIMQPDYDESTNIIIIGKNRFPRIVNSKFKIIGTTPIITDARPGNANSNTYVTSTLDKETRLEVFSDQVLKIAFNGIQIGGKIKPGNYQYIFYYMTEDFARTEVIGQSATCQVAFGSSYNTKRGGDQTEETGLKVSLTLTNVDTDFKYLKVYALYSSGLDGLQQQYLEFVNPLTISGSTIQFSHTGFESLKEVSQDVVNTSFYGIDSANTGEQINGYLILGGIQERKVSLQDLATGALAMQPEFNTKEIVPVAVPGYADPSNVYNYTGSFGDESYPYGVVYILPGGALSPAFPVQGKLFTSSIVSSNPVSAPSNQANGIVTFPSSNHFLPFSNGREQVKYIKIDVSSVPQGVKDVSIGFFIVRGERRPWLLSQGLMIPTVRISQVEYYDQDANYYDVFQAGTETTAYKLIPCVDQLLEAYQMDELGTSEDPSNVINDFFQLDKGYMPVYINDMKVQYGSSKIDNFPIDKWAFISGDALVNEPEFVTSLQRDSPYIFQLAKGQFRVKGQITPLFHQDSPGQPLPTVGLHYELESLTRYNTPGYKLCSSLAYVPAETYASGSEFISAVGMGFKFDAGSSKHAYNVRGYFNSYFGVKMTDALNDSTKGIGNPQAGNARMNNGGVRTLDQAHTSGVKYINLNSLIPAGFLVNIYSSNVRPTAASLYPTTDDIVYKQVTPRYTWAEAAALGNKIDVFGGDAYICKVSRKLNQSGFRNPNDAQGSSTRLANIDQGMMLTWWQESKYNLYLREPIQFDASEISKRSFFPFQSGGDFIKYRNYRYPETLKGSIGYSELLAPKSFIPTPSLSPATRNNFFSRLATSGKHIPNAFKNGYRIFLSTNFKDYESSMGEITEMHSLGNRLIVVFEHGVGEIAVDERVLAGRDSAGSVFAEPSSILPPSMKILSSTVGAQDPKGTIKTPQGIYGIDQDKRVIWMILDKFYSISDESISSYLQQNTIANPRCGYNFKYKEVLFTTDYWTLCFREGLNKFVSFYPFVSQFYALRGGEFYSFKVAALASAGSFHLHDADTRLIFGEQKDCFVEFVVNEGVTMDKIYDVIELVSNQVRPSKIEFFTYDKESKRLLILVPNGCQQYAKVQAGPNPFTDNDNIPFNRKRFVVKVPKTEIYNGELDTWGMGGRIRNIAIIVRITYNTSDPVQLMGVLSTMRPTAS